MSACISTSVLICTHACAHVCMSIHICSRHCIRTCIMYLCICVHLCISPSGIEFLPHPWRLLWLLIGQLVTAVGFLDAPPAKPASAKRVEGNAGHRATNTPHLLPMQGSVHDTSDGRWRCHCSSHVVMRYANLATIHNKSNREYRAV